MPCDTAPHGAEAPRSEPSALASSPCYLGEHNGPDPGDPGAVAGWRLLTRERLRAERLALSVESRRTMAEALARHLDGVLARRVPEVRGRVVSGYWPIKGEPDLRGWLAALHGRGAVVALPVVETRGAPLAFRRWEPGMAMERGHWNIPVPPESAERVTPEVALAPLMGWDMDGFRLGYGGGYFDRTLAALEPRPWVIGVGFQSARLDTIHPQPHDIPLSAIVTEAGLQVAR